MLIDLLEENKACYSIEYFINYNPLFLDEQRVTRVFWIFDQYLDIQRKNPYVLLVDNMYKVSKILYLYILVIFIYLFIIIWINLSIPPMCWEPTLIPFFFFYKLTGSISLSLTLQGLIYQVIILMWRLVFRVVRRRRTSCGSLSALRSSRIIIKLPPLLYLLRILVEGLRKLLSPPTQRSRISYVCSIL